MSAIPIIPRSEYKVEAALYFLEGQYLFKSYGEKTTRAKFVTAKDVQAAFDGREEDTGWLAPGVLRCGHHADGDWYVYSTPPQMVDISLVRGDGDLASIQIPIPRLVMASSGKHYYLWALVDKAFSQRAKVYRAPFPNVYENGLICWGNNPVPPSNVEKAREPWKLFFDTPFNGHLANNKANSHPSDVRNLLSELAERNARRFPIGELVDEGRDIGWAVENRLGLER